MANPDCRPIIIAGPTASGKSALALALAEDRASCIVNADALQVYDCWRVLTARPTVQDCQRAPHALYGHVDAARRYSVGDWLRDVEGLLTDLREQDLRPVFVGGTGLYLTALTEGLASIPRIPPEVRTASETALKEFGSARLADDIARDDPETFARIDVRNPVRVQRAWEVLKGTGRGLADWHRIPSKPVLEDWRGYVCQVEISQLNDNIRSRFEKMIEARCGRGMPSVSPCSFRVRICRRHGHWARPRSSTTWMANATLQAQSRPASLQPVATPNGSGPGFATGWPLGLELIHSTPQIEA